MNRERLKMVRDRIAAEPPELTRIEYFVGNTVCGTARSIGGWACVLMGELGYIRDANSELNAAGAWLDLNPIQYDELFYAMTNNIDLEQLTQADALAALDSLINADSDDALPIWPEARA